MSKLNGTDWELELSNVINAAARKVYMQIAFESSKGLGEFGPHQKVVNFLFNLNFCLVSWC